MTFDHDVDGDLEEMEWLVAARAAAKETEADKFGPELTVQCSYIRKGESCPHGCTAENSEGIHGWMQGMLEWFGENWHAPVNESCPKVPTPVGEDCVHGCSNLITEHEQGFMMMTPEGYQPIHRWCMLEETAGREMAQALREKFGQ